MKHLAIVMAFGAVLAMPATASAQAAGQGARTDLGGTQGAQTFSVRGHVIIWGAAGLDLDVIGDVTAGGLGSIRGTATAIDATAYPDIYVRTPRRRYLGVGYGLFDKAEVFARYQSARNPAATVLIGRMGTNTNTFPVGFDEYKDSLIEFGIRKYIATPRASREYFALVGGVKTVEPISMTMQPPGGDIRAELYSKSRIPSLGLEFGVTVEFHKIGVFIESGLRYQKRLTRNDDQLAAYQLQAANDTGGRFFMPANIGLLIRF